MVPGHIARRSFRVAQRSEAYREMREDKTFNLIKYELLRLHKKCADEKYYTGVTNNLERRLDQYHQGINKNCYTYLRRPLELVYKINFTNPKEAIKWEKKIKTWSKKKKEALINENWDDLIKFSKKPSHVSRYARTSLLEMTTRTNEK